MLFCCITSKGRLSPPYNKDIPGSRVLCPYWEDGTPVTKRRFIQRVRDALIQAGISHAGYSGHSFCIGVAMMFAEAGLGRWSSSAFLRYIRVIRQQLSCHTATLAGQVSTHN